MNVTAFQDAGTLAPELVLAGGGVLVLLIDAFLPRLGRVATPLAVVATLASAHLCFWGGALGPSFHGLIDSTALTVGISLIILTATLLALLASHGYLERERLHGAEYQALLLWCATGLLLMARATELITVFVALELLSICLYSLAAYHRRFSVVTEAGVKYFLLGAFVSSFVVLGIALLYGETGSTRLDVIGASPELGSPLAILGLLLLVAGFGFKMSVAPFHAWAPDTYQGAPTPFVGFLSVAPKAASAVVLVRLLAVAYDTDPTRWSAVIGALALLSMVVGNVLALVQRDVKRMLAYSGIAHMGYLLVALTELGGPAREALLVYLLAYTLMNAGAFAVITLLYPAAGEQHLISDLGGWGYRFPLLGVCLTICMLSLGGIPPTLGFVGKYLVFMRALEAGSWGLAVAIVVTSLVGVFYYLRVVYTLYMRPEVRSADGLRLDPWGRSAAVLAALATLVLGLLPAQLLGWVYRVAQTGL